MTDQDPYRWPQPDHPARHAGQPRLLAPRFQRALRLLVAAGIAAAGLCLVIGAVTLVVAVSGASRGDTVTPAAHQSPTLHSGRRHPGRVHSGRGGTVSAQPVTGQSSRPVLLLGLAGHGSGSTRKFRVGGSGTWQLSWSYTGCRAAAGRAAFGVTDGSPAGISLTESGPAGHGDTRVYGDPGWHRLSVRSGCAWTIRVTGPR